MDSTALNLKWVFGMNKNVLGAVHNLSDEERECIFYSSAHVGVIYDIFNSSQRHLMGHTNEIKATCVSSDRRWIVTADQGKDNMIVFWDSYKGMPVKTIYQPHPFGVETMHLSVDASLLVTLSKTDTPEEPQYIAVWDWASGSPEPVSFAEIQGGDYQICVRFSSRAMVNIVTNGKKSVMFWNIKQTGKMTYYIPSQSARDLKHVIGNFTQSLFIPESDSALSATVDGDVILWDRSNDLTDVLPAERKAVKVVRLHDSTINLVTHTQDYLVTGGADGFVRFFDFQFRLVAWFEDLNAGPVVSVSFANKPVARYEESAVLYATDFIIATTHGTVLSVNPKCFEELEQKKREGTLLLQLQDGAVHALAAHPFRQQLAVSGHTGLIQLWDYGSKKLRISRKFEKLMGHCIAFSPKGHLLAVGFTNGALKILSARSLKDIPKGTHRNSRECITNIIFSNDSLWLALSDIDCCVSVYKSTMKRLQGSNDEEVEEWQYVGKYRSHLKPVTGLFFEDTPSPIDSQTPQGPPRLLSIGQDRKMVRYDLSKSNVKDGLIIQATHRIEQTANPTAFVASPDGSNIILVNDHYKMKLLEKVSNQCRKTVLGPTYGLPMNSILILPKQDNSDSDQYLVYSTPEKVIGLVQFPLDGNPNRSMGLIAHPNVVSRLAYSYDGRYIFTAGGPDMSVHIWEIDYPSLRASMIRPVEEDPFVSLIEGGKGGVFWNEMKEFFHYAQLRSQGEHSLEAHSIGSKVDIQEVPNIMRALGFYPTEEEIQNLLTEIKYSKYASTGEYVTHIGFEDLIRLYVNHRPVFSVTKQQIRDAFEMLGAQGGQIAVEKLVTLLGEHAERMSFMEVRNAMEELIGEGQYDFLNERSLTADEFAEEVLGFEE